MTLVLVVVGSANEYYNHYNRRPEGKWRSGDWRSDSRGYRDERQMNRAVEREVNRAVEREIDRERGREVQRGSGIQRAVQGVERVAEGVGREIERNVRRFGSIIN